MHLYDTITGEAARQYCQSFLKMNPDEWSLDAVSRIEVFVTDITDDGPDFCEYKVIDSRTKSSLSGMNSDIELPQQMRFTVLSYCPARAILVP